MNLAAIVKQHASDAKINQFGQNPSVIVIGESHGDGSHVFIQEQIIASTNPEYMLHEFLRNYFFDVGTNTFAANPAYPTSSDLERFRKQLVEDMYGLDLGLLSGEFEDWLGNFSINHTIDDFSMGYIASDFEGAGIGSILQSFQSQTPIAYVGCDLPYFQIYFEEDKRGVDYGSFASIDADPEVNQLREKRMGRVVADYNQRTSQPLVVVVGAYHVRDDSAIHEVLNNARVEYIVANLSTNSHK